jgi:hypothetical protein
MRKVEDPERGRGATAVDLRTVTTREDLPGWEVADAVWATGLSIVIGKLTWQGDLADEYVAVMRKPRSRLTVREDVTDFSWDGLTPGQGVADLALLTDVLATGDVPCGWDGWWVR